MRVGARQGPQVYLVSALNDLEAAYAMDRPVARVLDLKRGILHPPNNLHSIFSRGHWEPYELSEAETRELLQQATTIYGPGIDEPWELPRRYEDFPGRGRIYY